MDANVNPPAYIGLGSNLPSLAGNPSATVLAAIEALCSSGSIVARSSLYTTAPVGFAEQPTFVNAVVALATALTPGPLLDRLLGIEQQFGRDRRTGLRNGPRTLDLDLLIYGATLIRSPRLTLPHPSLAQRRFVLEPLAEIAPALRHPTLHRTIAELLHALPDEGENSPSTVIRLSPAFASIS